MESLVSCLGAGDAEGGGDGGEVEKLAQQLATLEVRLWVDILYYRTMISLSVGARA